MCTIWWILVYVYTCETITITKIMNIFITAEVSFLPTGNSIHLLPSLRERIFSFKGKLVTIYYYWYISLDFTNQPKWFIKMLFLPTFNTHSFLRGVLINAVCMISYISTKIDVLAWLVLLLICLSLFRVNKMMYVNGQCLHSIQ